MHATNLLEHIVAESSQVEQPRRSKDVEYKEPTDYRTVIEQALSSEDVHHFFSSRLVGEVKTALHAIEKPYQDRYGDYTIYHGPMAVNQ